MRWFRTALLLLVAVILVENPVAAGVRGGRFAGGFVTNLGFFGINGATFTDAGQLDYWEYGVLFGGTYASPFTETGTGWVTSWAARVPDESPDGFADFSGVCYFGLLTSIHNQNLDQGITFDGWMIRTGAVTPQRSTR